MFARVSERFMEDREYYVRFYYSRRRGAKPPRATYCEVLRKNPNGPEKQPWEVVSSGRAIRDPRDTFLKPDGRWYALRRAVSTLDRATRVAIMREYMQTATLPNFNRIGKEAKAALTVTQAA